MLVHCDFTGHWLYNLVYYSGLQEFDMESKLIGQYYYSPSIIPDYRLNLVLQHGCRTNAKCRILDICLPNWYGCLFS